MRSISEVINADTTHTMRTRSEIVNCEAHPDTSIVTTNPLSLVRRAVLPALGAVAAAFGMVLVVPQYPAVSVIAGKPIPSDIVPTGTILAKTDNATIGPENFSLVFPSNIAVTRMIVWDYAAEDGDMVAVVIGGAPETQSFTIYHAPKVLNVPVGAEVRVIGTHDGGGGITYAVNFPDIGKTIVNGLNPGQTTLFKLIRRAGPSREQTS